MVPAASCVRFTCITENVVLSDDRCLMKEIVDFCEFVYIEKLVFKVCA